MSYTKLNFVNGEAPALSADNLNHMETGISDVHTALDNMDAGLVTYDAEWTEGYYVNTAGKMVSSDYYSYTDIELNAGETLTATLYGSSDKVALLSVKTDDDFLTVVNASTSTEFTHSVTYVAETAATVRLTNWYSQTATVLKGYLCANMLAHSENFIKNSGIGLKRLTTDDYTQVEGKYVNYLGYIYTLSGYSYYDIDLKAYETIEAYVKGTGTKVALLSTFGDDGTCTPSIISTDGNATTITYTAKKAETIRISSVNSSSFTPYFNKGYTSFPDVFDVVNSQIQEIAESADVLKYRTMFYNVACIGDSITRGSRGASYTVTEKFNYPVQLQRQSGGAITTTNLGHSGATPLTYWQSWGSSADYSGYDAFIIELGTNGSTGTVNQMTDTIDDDASGDDYTAYADTATGRYCSLIEKIQEQSPHAYIFMCSSYVPAKIQDGTNDVLKKIAEKYGCKWIDLSAFANQTVPNAWFAEDKYHPSDVGYSKLADTILRQMCAHVIADPDYFNTHTWDAAEAESEES